MAFYSFSKRRCLKAPQKSINHHSMVYQIILILIRYYPFTWSALKLYFNFLPGPNFFQQIPKSSFLNPKLFVFIDKSLQHIKLIESKQKTNKYLHRTQIYSSSTYARYSGWVKFCAQQQHFFRRHFFCQFEALQWDGELIFLSSGKLI